MDKVTAVQNTLIYCLQVHTVH